MKKSGKKITLDDLAAMVAEGFSGMATKDNLKSMATKADIAKLEQGQEDIKLRLDNVAYRFELVELQKRVTRLEQKTGMIK
ncbi:MAG: hypothetical protein M1383_04200 [Patescibacteria group bacterium]|nr:hypothetical protein [Patescibacteria group bacterium]